MPTYFLDVPRNFKMFQSLYSAENIVIQFCD